MKGWLTDVPVSDKGLSSAGFRGRRFLQHPARQRPVNFDPAKARVSHARLIPRGARIGARELFGLSGARAVIFDMDGVLADTEEYHLESWRSCLHSRYGLAPAQEVIRRTFGQSNEQILPLLVTGAEP